MQTEPPFRSILSHVGHEYGASAASSDWPFPPSHPPENPGLRAMLNHVGHSGASTQLDVPYVPPRHGPGSGIPGCMLNHVGHTHSNSAQLADANG